MIFKTIKVLVTPVTVSCVLLAILGIVSGCQPVSVPSYRFHPETIQPLALKVSSLRWQWEEDFVQNLPIDVRDISPKDYLESALSRGLVCAAPESGPLIIQIQSVRWSESPEPAGSQPRSFFDSQPGTIARVDYNINVGEPDTHGFQKRSVNVQVYDQVLIPHNASLQEHQAKLHELVQGACEHILRLLQERLTQRFSDLMIDAPFENT